MTALYGIYKRKIFLKLESFFCIVTLPCGPIPPSPHFRNRFVKQSWRGGGKAYILICLFTKSLSEVSPGTLCKQNCNLVHCLLLTHVIEFAGGVLILFQREAGLYSFEKNDSPPPLKKIVLPHCISFKVRSFFD